jgi:hypothetical protein
MRRLLRVAMCLAAGLSGGLISRYVNPPVAFAQDQQPPTSEIRAQAFVLTDQSGKPLAKLVAGAGAVQNPSKASWQLEPKILLLDMDGRQLWSAGGAVLVGPIPTVPNGREYK